jgi:predicted peroxiredoxin
MAKFLIHVTCGVENPTKAALAFLVGRTAIEERHDVTFFLAGDAAQLLRSAVVDNLAGLGTGSLKEHLAVIADGGGRFYVSGMSARGRGVGSEDFGSVSAELVRPDVLIKLAAQVDRVLCY